MPELTPESLRPIPADLAVLVAPIVRYAAEGGEYPPWNGTVTPEGQRWALKLLRERCDIVAGTEEGDRNNALNAAAVVVGHYVPHLIDEDVARDALILASEACGLVSGRDRGQPVRQPRKGLQQVLATITSGFQEGRRTPQGARPIGGVFLDVSPKVIESPTVLSEEFWSARPVFLHIRQAAQARRASPEAVLGVALARVMTQVGPGFQLPPIVGGTASLNLYVVLMGNSAGGKGAATRVAEWVVNTGSIFTLKPGSGEGLASAFARLEKGPDGKYRTEIYRMAVLLDVPEVSGLEALARRNGSTLLSELASAWSAEPLGFGYRDPQKAVEVPAHTYRLCAVVGAQYGKARALLQEHEIGFPQRFLWLDTRDPGAPDERPPDPGIWRDWTCPLLPEPFGLLQVCQEAWNEIDAVRLAGLRSGIETNIDGHDLQNQLRIGAGLGALDGRAEVSGEDWALARMLIERSRAVREQAMKYQQRLATVDRKTKGRMRAVEDEEYDDVRSEADERRHDRQVAALAERLARHVQGHAPKCPGQLCRKGVCLRDLAGKLQRPLLPEAIRRAEAHDWIEAVPISGQGRPGTGYRAGPAAP